MYKVYQKLTETPLPGDWDSEAINKSTTFTRIIKLAVEKSKKLGTGSSRVAFEVSDPGFENTVIKVAKNKKGLLQNELEGEIMSLGWYKDQVPKLLDIDQDSQIYKREGQPLWLQVERARKPKPSEINTFLGLKDVNNFRRYLSKIFGRYNTSEFNEDFKILDNNEWMQELIHMIGDFDLAWQDIPVIRNLGFVGDTLKVIDVGASNNIIKTYYHKGNLL